MNYQRVASIVRQVLAVAAIVMGALTSALSSIKLPTGVSAVLVAVGAAVLGIEHYVSDPTTGTGTPSVPTPAAPVQALQSSFPQPTPAPPTTGPTTSAGFPAVPPS